MSFEAGDKVYFKGDYGRILVVASITDNGGVHCTYKVGDAYKEHTFRPEQLEKALDEEDETPVMGGMA